MIIVLESSQIPSHIQHPKKTNSEHLLRRRHLSSRTKKNMPPPHLHPRSRMTSSLFATTMFASFFVVALPHVLPCPAPRVAYADGEIIEDQNGRRRRRRQRIQAQEPTIKDGIVDFNNIAAADVVEQEEGRRRSRRECPVPKPGGKVGEFLGFKNTSSEGAKGSRGAP